MNKKNLILLVITLGLFIIPFFWFRPGEMDLGGDSSRLYFYDPISYLKVETLYGVISSGVGGENISYYAIPYILLLWLVKLIVHSPTFLNAIFNGISLSLAFLSIYWIIKDFLILGNKGKDKYTELIAVLSGIFYLFTPTLLLGWDKAILTHNQIFLNPLIFFLLFRFITKNEWRYLFGLLLISFIFAPNFSFVAAPAFFSFYPLTVIFIFIYTKFILKQMLPIKKIAVGLLLFILLHLFHLGPQITSLFTSGSAVNTSVFSAQAKYSRGLDYFTGVAPQVKVSISFLNLAQLTQLQPIDYSFIIFPVILLLGFLLKKSKQYLLTALFFLVTFFFVTANITDIGFALYVKLFDIPGFSMFRNYFGQWVFVFTFFYTLLFGQALLTVFQRLKLRYISLISIFIIVILLYNALPFISGSYVNKIHFQSNNVRISSQIDSEYENVLSYIRSLNVDGKFLSLPLTDAGYQIISGKNGGAYQGPSTISYLTGKNDFTGYDGLIPFNDTFLTLVKNNDITGINRLFSILNIKYVFYNSDPNIYDNNFPQYPYTFVKGTMPNTQKDYQIFLTKLPIHKVKDIGSNYHIYEVNNYLPHFYIADNTIYSSDALTPFFTLNLKKSSRSVVYTTDNMFDKSNDVILAATNVNPLADLLDNYHLHVHDPFISKRMDDIIYPFVVWNEKRSLRKLTATSTDYVDYSLLYLAKRVSELNNYDQTPITHQQFHEPKLWQFYYWSSYNSWESNITRFNTQANTLIDWINTAPISESEKNTQRIKVDESLYGLELRLRLIISSSTHSPSDKAYLQNNVNDIFSQLFQKLNLTPIYTSQVPYKLNISKELEGEFIPYLQSEKSNPLDPSIYTLKINNQTTTAVNSKKNSLITFKPIEITNTQSTVTLLYKPQNVLGSEKWEGLGSVTDTPSQTDFAIDDRFGAGSGFSRKITGYQPDTQYIITFEYYTEGDDLLFGLYEKQMQAGVANKETYFNKILSSKKWTTQQSIVTSSPGAVAAYLQVVTINENELYKGKLHIRNFSVVPVPNDTLFFRKIKPTKQQQIIPTLQFKKINPTRYILHVTNAVNPYTLVFAEAFSNHWKLYLPTQTPTQSSNLASYFNGSIQEEKPDSTFFHYSFLHNGQLIQPDNHTIGNGYENVWNISPANVGNKKDYYLVIVYTPQISFYYFAAISFVTLLFILVLAIVFIVKKK